MKEAKEGRKEGRKEGKKVKRESKTKERQIIVDFFKAMSQVGTW